MNKKITILICEDDEDDQYLIKSILEENNIEHEVIFADNGQKAMDFIQNKNNKVSLVLLDLNMPVVDGREVLKQIKSHSELGKLPVIVFTTSNAGFDIEQCYAIGANCYIIKPSSYERLNDILLTIMRFWTEMSKLPQ